MARKRFPPTDPREWLRRAQINLARAQSVLPEADFEDYCFDAQQAAEKAVKAVFILNGASFKFVHDLGQLLKGLSAAGVKVPKYLLTADRLTRYAVLTRYPGFSAPVTKTQHTRAVRIAARVVAWAERQIRAQYP
jgi:HEPN domain-containing protein